VSARLCRIFGQGDWRSVYLLDRKSSWLLPRPEYIYMVHPRNVWEFSEVDVVSFVDPNDPAVDMYDVDYHARMTNRLGTRHAFLHLGEPSEMQLAARS
jgi:hypothetical protein